MNDEAEGAGVGVEVEAEEDGTAAAGAGVAVIAETGGEGNAAAGATVVAAAAVAEVRTMPFLVARLFSRFPFFLVVSGRSSSTERRSSSVCHSEVVCRDVAPVPSCSVSLTPPNLLSLFAPGRSRCSRRSRDRSR